MLIMSTHIKISGVIRRYRKESKLVPIREDKHSYQLDTYVQSGYQFDSANSERRFSKLVWELTPHPSISIYREGRSSSLESSSVS